jgi:hypothetical protein
MHPWDTSKSISPFLANESNRSCQTNQVRYICDNTLSYNRIRVPVQLTEAIALSTFPEAY